MADYVIRVEASTSDAESKLKRVERQVQSIDKNVNVNLSLSNIDQVIQKVGQFTQATASAAKQAIDLSRTLNVGPGAVLNDLAELFEKVSRRGGQAVSVMDQLAKATPTRILSTAFDTASSSAIKFSRGLADIGYEIFGLTQSVGILRQAFGGMFEETIGREIRLQESLLRTKTTLISTADVMRNGVRIRDPFEAIKALEKPIDQTLANIRRRSLDIAGTTSDAIIQVFGVVAGQIGRVGGSLKDAEDLAISFAGALGTIGMADPMLANQEIRSIMTGDIDNNSVLARSLGITNIDIDRAKKSSEGLVKWLQKRLEGFAAGQKLAAQSFGGITSNLQEIREEALRSLGKPLLAPLLESLTNVYLNLSNIFDLILKISANAGRAAANAVNIFKAAGTQSPILQSIQLGPAAERADSYTNNFANTVAAELREVQPLITRIMSELTEGLARVTQGLGALLQGFAYFKFEELKIIATQFANMATLLNDTLIPAVQTMLNLYGQFLQLPLVNYINQVNAAQKLLEEIGVMSVVRLVATWKLYQESINTFIGWIKTAFNAVKAAFDFIIESIAGSISGLGTTIKTVLTKITIAIQLVAKTIVALVFSAISQIGVQIVNLGVSISNITPKLLPLGAQIASVGQSFIKVGQSVDIVTAKINQLATDAKIAFAGVQTSLDGAATNVRKFGSTIGTQAVAGLKLLGGKLLGIGMQLLKFQIYIFVIEKLTAAFTDLYGRIQRANERNQANTAVEEALGRMKKGYTEAGKELDEFAQKQKNLDEQILSTNYDANLKEIGELTDKIERLQNATGFEKLMMVLDVGEDISFLLEDLKTTWESISKIVGDIPKQIASISDSLTNTVIGKVVRQLYLDIVDLFNALKDLKNLGQDSSGKKSLFRLVLEELNPGMKNAEEDPTLAFANRLLTRRTDKAKKERSEILRQNEQIRDALRQKETDAQIALVAKERNAAAKELKQLERQLTSEIQQAQAATQLKEIEHVNRVGQLRLDKVKEANLLAIKGVTNEAEAQLKATAEYISKKESRELDLNTARRKFEVEMMNLEFSIGEYRIALEEKLAAIRQRSMVPPNLSNSSSPEQQTGGFLVGSTGTSSGPHLHISNALNDWNAVLREARHIIKEWQKQGVDYIVLSNANIDVKNLRDDASLTRALQAEQRAHALRSKGGAIDIAVPAGTRVPGESGTPSWDGGGGGWIATSLRTGNTWMHGLKSSTASGGEGPPSSKQTAGASASANLAGYLRRLADLETDLRPRANEQGSGAQGYFQTKSEFDTEARTASGGLNSRSSNYDEAAGAVGAWIKRHRPKAYEAIQNGNFNVADVILAKGTFPSLPTGSQARSAEKQKQVNRHLPGGTQPYAEASGAGGPDVAALDKNLLARKEAYQRQLMQMNMRDTALQKQINDFEAAKEFKNLVDNLTIKRPFKELALELEQGLYLLEDALSRPIGFSDSETVSIINNAVSQFRTETLTSKEILAGYQRAISDAKASVTSKDPATRLTQEEANNRIKEYTRLLEEATKAQNTNRDSLVAETAERLKISTVRKQIELGNSLADLRGSLGPQLKVATSEFRLEMAKALSAGDIRASRSVTAEGIISNLLNQIESKQIPLTAELIENIRSASEEVRANQAAFASLEESTKHLMTTFSAVREVSRTTSEGMKSLVRIAVSGGDPDQVRQTLLDMANKFLDMTLSYMFAPIEKFLQNSLMALLTPQGDPAKALQAENNLRLASLAQSTGALNSSIQQLIARIDGLTGAPTSGVGSLARFTAPADNLTFGSTTLPSTLPDFNTSIDNLTSGFGDAALTLDGFSTEAAFTSKQFLEFGKYTAANTQALGFFGKGLMSVLQGISGGSTSGGGIFGTILSIAGSFLGGLGGSGSTILPSTLPDFNPTGVAFNPAAWDFRANGGPVSARSPYVVGERGPELFVPSSGGHIVPNSELGRGGSVSVVVNVDAKGSKVEGDDNRAKQLGAVLSTAIQQELIKQKRPGGLLS